MQVGLGGGFSALAAVLGAGLAELVVAGSCLTSLTVRECGSSMRSQPVADGRATRAATTMPIRRMTALYHCWGRSREASPERWTNARSLSETGHCGVLALVSYARDMHWGRIVALLAALALPASCGGTTGVEPETSETGGSDSGGTSGVGTGGRLPVDASDADDIPDVVQDVNSDYVAPVCPDAPPPPIEQECDLFSEVSGCPPGLGCFPYVEYPAPGDDCAQERFGTECFLAGTGRQGDPCDAGDCAANHLCVLTGEGTICVELCSTLGGDTCPPGLLCEPIDVQPGVGGCY